MRWIRLVFILLVNAVPLYGVMYRDWSVGTVLLLYWLENLLIGVFTTARIALHRAWTHKSGHWRRGVFGGTVNGKPDRAVLLDDYAGFAIFFTLVQGGFAALVVFVLGPDYPMLRFSADQFWQGAWQMLVVLATEFAVDVPQIRSRSFAWIKAYARQRMRRVVILHLTIILGVWGMAASQSPIAIVYALIGLKTLWDVLSGSAAESGRVAEPPSGPGTVAARLRTAQGNEAAWQRERELAPRCAIEDEKVKPA